MLPKHRIRDNPSENRKDKTKTQKRRKYPYLLCAQGCFQLARRRRQPAQRAHLSGKGLPQLTPELLEQHRGEPPRALDQHHRRCDGLAWWSRGTEVCGGHYVIVHIEKIDAGVHVHGPRGRHRRGAGVPVHLRRHVRSGGGCLSGDQVAAAGDSVGTRRGGRRRRDGRRSFIFNHFDFLLKLRKRSKWSILAK